MQLTRVLTALKKNKIEVKQVDRWGTGNFTYTAGKGDHALDFRENGKGSNEVCYFVARHPDTDASVDLFMDSYFKTIKSAIQFLKGTP